MSARDSGPYRSGHGDAPVAPADEQGLVGDLIRQFADPLAFFRELVQNSIDAGATHIAITLRFDPDESGSEPSPDQPGEVVIAVRDDGCGMTREVLEQQLTVLFRSGKEGQQDKIGKFGVGFVSVLALAPELVTVRTTVGDGTLWTLELKSDQTYELFRAGGGGRSSTSVTLSLRRAFGEFERLVRDSERAARRWCRHAELPIRFVASRGGDLLHRARIDRPLAVDDTLASVLAEDGGTAVAAGLSGGRRGRLAFFNRGLLLFETVSEALNGLNLSVQDARLEHTLSRDNVRRDEHYERAMAFVRRVVARDLSLALSERLLEVTTGRREAPSVEALLQAADTAGVYPSADVAWIRLVEPSGDKRSLSLSLSGLRRGRVVWDHEHTELTAAVNRLGWPIVDTSIATDRHAYVSALQRLAGDRPLLGVRDRFTLVTEDELTDADGALLDRVTALIDAVHRRPSGLTFAQFEGRYAAQLWISSGVDLPLLLQGEKRFGDPLRALLRPRLILNAGAEVVVEARRLAATQPGVSAALLTAALLLDLGRFDEDVAGDWLERASAELDA